MLLASHEDPNDTFNSTVRVCAQKMHYGFTEKEIVETLAKDENITESEAFLLAKAGELYMKF